MKNIEKKVTNIEDAKWVWMTMNVLAEEKYNEFNFDICDTNTKIEIITRMLEDQFIKV
jgi:hypothetical protein|tara:strand:- start:6805 stop:6978 length:174 start_codon:yes stop_codon:yes gene_type:complete